MNTITTTIGNLPTSRLATHQERGVLAVLRSKTPRRQLLPREAEQVAEWQAITLLELAGLRHPATPSSLIAELPRVRVNLDPDLPESGTTIWRNGRWLIMISSSEPEERQRFSLAHEFKHVIDYPLRDLLYGGDHEQAELAADFFAASLLMPRGWIKAAWGDGTQSITDLCKLFRVSPPAMARRLAHLGLREQPLGRHQRENDVFINRGDA